MLRIVISRFCLTFDFFDWALIVETESLGKPSPLKTEEGVIVGLFEVCEGTTGCCHYLKDWLVHFIEKGLMLISIFETLEILELLIRFLKLDELWDSL